MVKLKKDYESLFIFNPELADEKVEQELKKLEYIITKAGGKISTVQNWGRRRLAYEIKKHTQGYYVLLRFKSDPSALKDIERKFRLADPVLRVLTLSIKPNQVDEIQKPDLVAEKEE